MSSYCNKPSAFGMGVNVPDVRLVIHWAAPNLLNCYKQQCLGTPYSLNSYQQPENNQTTAQEFGI